MTPFDHEPSPTLDSYLEARRIAGKTIRPMVNQRIGKKLFKDSLLRLGIAQRDLALLNEAGLSLVQDYLAYSRHRKKSLIDRLCDDSPFEEGSLEATVLEAMQNSLLSLFRVEQVHGDSSMELLDVIGDRTGRLFDRNLTASAYKGLWYATRVYDMPDFWMTSGAAVVLTETQAHELWERCEEFGIDEDGRLTRRQPPKYVNAFYRYLLESGAADFMGTASAFQ